jgi:hypothetical protein
LDGSESGLVDPRIRDPKVISGVLKSQINTKITTPYPESSDLRASIRANEGTTYEQADVPHQNTEEVDDDPDWDPDQERARDSESSLEESDEEEEESEELTDEPRMFKRTKPKEISRKSTILFIIKTIYPSSPTAAEV